MADRDCQSRLYPPGHAISLGVDLPWCWPFFSSVHGKLCPHKQWGPGFKVSALCWGHFRGTWALAGHLLVWKLQYQQVLRTQGSFSRPGMAAGKAQESLATALEKDMTSPERDAGGFGDNTSRCWVWTQSFSADLSCKSAACLAFEGF